jgi:heme-degrading monooxygenase HmoA
MFFSQFFFNPKTKEVFMIARLTFFNIGANDVDDVKRIYNEECVPVIKAQKGNVGAWLLEPTNPEDDYISLTEWLSLADAESYETSGTYQSLVNKIKDRFKGSPVLKTYTAAETKIVTPA